VPHAWDIVWIETSHADQSLFDETAETPTSRQSVAKSVQGLGGFGFI